MTGRVSVVMATKNSGARLSRALKSIDEQGDLVHEVIAVDAGSQDGTQEKLKAHPRVRLMQEQNVGLAAAWNQGLELVTGEYIAFLDSDDYWMPNALASHLEILNTDVKVGATVGQVKFFLDQATIPANFRSELLGKTVIGNMPGTVMLRRNELAIAGSFPTELGIAADIEWFARLRSRLGVHEIDSLVLCKSVHDTNLSYTHVSGSMNQYNESIIQVVRNQLGRNRE